MNLEESIDWANKMHKNTGSHYYVCKWNDAYATKAENYLKIPHSETVYNTKTKLVNPHNKHTTELNEYRCLKKYTTSTLSNIQVGDILSPVEHNGKYFFILGSMRVPYTRMHRLKKHFELVEKSDIPRKPLVGNKERINKLFSMRKLMSI
jgi:hypothetical protein